MHNAPSQRDEQSSNAVVGRRLSRRRLLAAGTTIGIAGVAGCTQIANYIAGQILEDVNLFNETDRRLTGSITVTDPEGSTVLDEMFSAEPASDDEVDEDAGASYADVLTVAGSYTVSVELDEPVEDETTAEATVEIEDPNEEHIIIVFGADDLDAAIGVLVIEEFTDIGEYIDG